MTDAAGNRMPISTLPLETNPSVKLSRKMPQLDALRAFAVLAVLFNHFIYHPPPWLSYVPWAHYGVQLFFVLSGFLITGILLDCRREVEEGARRGRMLRQFYARRFLRIFPLYYAVLAAGCLLDIQGFRDALGWHVAYLTNAYVILKNSWVGWASHLWTLSVEEQFYLFWPCIVLFIPKKALLPAFTAITAFALVFRCSGVFCGWSNLRIYVASFTSVDAFGAGALLALARRRAEAGNPKLQRQLRAVGLWVGGPLLILLTLSQQFPPRFHWMWIVGANLAMALFFGWLVSQAADGVGGAVGRVLTLPPLLYLGKISYGIYLFHAPMRGVIEGSGLGFPNWVHWHIPYSAIYFAATVLAAAISWHFYERPINNLKRFFPYRDSKRLRPAFTHDLAGSSRNVGDDTERGR